jgi:hypothetical protein
MRRVETPELSSFAAEALKTLQEALAVARDVGDRHTEAEIICDIAEVRRALGDRASAARDYEQCEQLYDRLGDSVGALSAVLVRAEMAVAAGETAAAGRLVRTAAGSSTPAPTASRTTSDTPGHPARRRCGWVSHGSGRRVGGRRAPSRGGAGGRPVSRPASGRPRTGGSRSRWARRTRAPAG